ncbi:MAG TPA: FHA domain-containing protein [Solirubrobacteraceae bacterium]|nr:FHA domain-containing protein [Solirubrobacteraceae bacterium]
MLCTSCRRQLSRGAEYCGTCGTPVAGAAAPLELVLADDTRVPLVGDMTIGRAPGSSVVLADPSVSREHARISPGGNGGGVSIEDAGSSAGTLVDGVAISAATALQDGSQLQIGGQTLRVERRRDTAEAGRTIVVRPGASVVVPALGPPGVAAAATQFGMKPRVRSGYALKRLDASEGSKRWVLKDLNRNTFLRLSDNDAHLFELLDGTHSLSDLIGTAEQRFGAAGAPRLARLLADLGERGYLAGVAGADVGADAPQGFLRKLFKPREKTIPGLGPWFDWLYRRGGWVLFTRPALYAIAVLIVAGLAAFAYLVIGRYGTPFVVSQRIELGALVFLLGRFAIVAVHETAHGLAMASFGRRIDKAGVKLVAIFPYAFVDTSEAWFEPRKRRIAISAAGPISDFALGAIFSICCVFVDGTVRDVFFQLAFAGYVGAFFNLNPFIDRDGYHILVDYLREPGLRRRAKDQFSRRLSGKARTSDSPVLARYSIAGIGWSILAAGFAIFMSLRYEPIMSALAPSYVVWTVLGTLWLALFVPVVVVLGKPLVERVRGPRAAAT